MKCLIYIPVSFSLFIFLFFLSVPPPLKGCIVIRNDTLVAGYGTTTSNTGLRIKGQFSVQIRNCDEND